MTLGELYDLAIQWGVRKDPRGREPIEKQLQQLKEEYEKLTGKEKDSFDVDRLRNPYPDSRILCGEHQTGIESILVGIDIEVGEILLAEQLKQRGQQIDLLLAHHPEGRAMINLYAVMDMQADILSRYGVPIAVAEGILTERIHEVERRLHPANYTRSVDAARLLRFPFLCVHTPSDNGVATFLQELMDNERPDKVKDLLDLLREIPEYDHRWAEGGGPAIFSGSKETRAGKIFVDMTGGTGGAKESFEKLAQSGVSTVLGMHIGEDHLKEAKKHHLNVVIAGHIGSDCVGMNLFLDEVERQFGPLEILACSGFKRVNRLS